MRRLLSYYLSRTPNELFRQIAVRDAPYHPRIFGWQLDEKLRFSYRKCYKLTFSDPTKTMPDIFERMKRDIFDSQKVQLKIVKGKQLPLKILGNHKPWKAMDGMKLYMYIHMHTLLRKHSFSKTMPRTVRLPGVRPGNCPVYWYNECTKLPSMANQETVANLESSQQSCYLCCYN